MLICSLIEIDKVRSKRQEPHCCGSCRISGLPESVLLDFLDAEPLHVRLTQAEELDEVGAIDIAYILGLDGVVPAHLLGYDLKGTEGLS